VLQYSTAPSQEFSKGRTQTFVCEPAEPLQQQQQQPELGVVGGVGGAGMLKMRGANVEEGIN
jgi:hypothetical protein